MIISLAATASSSLAAWQPFPRQPLAQQAGSQSEVVVYGSDPCPRSTELNIVVCVHRPETERYRLPKSQQLLGTAPGTASLVEPCPRDLEFGKTGINSCSPVGPGGHTGCLIQEINQARRENGETSDETPQ